MTETMEEERWPGEQLGLPESGAGSLATWRNRITAIVLDWAACMLASAAILGLESLRANDWRAFGILAFFFIESTVLTATVGGSLGQLITRIAVVRVDGEPLGILRAAGRAFLVCLALPALVIGMHRRGLHDLVVGTVVVNRR